MQNFQIWFVFQIYCNISRSGFGNGSGGDNSQKAVEMI